MSHVDPELEHAEMRVGRTLRGKWHLDRLLGVGGMAAVYAATHRNAKRVAIKMLHPEVSAIEAVKARFLREGYAANTVDHPGAVSVFDDDLDDDGAAFLVMELLEGETLEQLRERHGGCVPPDDLLPLMNQALDALGAAHAKGIIHRDLKPENLFLTHDGVVKILDFGIARLGDFGGAKSATRTGVAMGTPAFMPPEQASGRWKLVDERSDVWAAGATIYTLLSGRFVHDRETLPEMLVAAITEPSPGIRTVCPGLSPAIASVVDRSLAFEKEGRWPNARAMRDALRGAHLAATGAPIAPAPSRTVPGSSRSLNKTAPADFAETDAMVAAPLASKRSVSALEAARTAGSQAFAATIPELPATSPPQGSNLPGSSRRPVKRLVAGAAATSLVLVVIAGSWLFGAPGRPAASEVNPTATAESEAPASPSQADVVPTSTGSAPVPSSSAASASSDVPSATAVPPAPPPPTARPVRPGPRPTKKVIKGPLSNTL